MPDTDQLPRRSSIAPSTPSAQASSSATSSPCSDSHSRTAVSPGLENERTLRRPVEPRGQAQAVVLGRVGRVLGNRFVQRDRKFLDAHVRMVALDCYRCERRPAGDPFSFAFDRSPGPRAVPNRPTDDVRRHRYRMTDRGRIPPGPEHAFGTRSERPIARCAKTERVRSDSLLHEKSGMSLSVGRGSPSGCPRRFGRRRRGGAMSSAFSAGTGRSSSARRSPR